MNLKGKLNTELHLHWILSTKHYGHFYRLGSFNLCYLMFIIGMKMGLGLRQTILWGDFNQFIKPTYPIISFSLILAQLQIKFALTKYFKFSRT